MNVFFLDVDSLRTGNRVVGGKFYLEYFVDKFTYKTHTYVQKTFFNLLDKF